LFDKKGLFMNLLVPIGTIVTLLGLAILIWCILRVAQARKTIKNDIEMRGKLQKMATMNMIALFLSFVGLMIVIFGVIL
jgi:hypothetical protein